jgi:hypothetical protein
MAHPRPFYDLDNFRAAMAWLRRRYADLLAQDELRFMEAFEELPPALSRRASTSRPFTCCSDVINIWSRGVRWSIGPEA